MAAEPGLVVVVGASAGGIEALTKLVGALPADLKAAVLVTVHLPAGGKSALGQILTRSGRLPAAPAAHDEPLVPGAIRVAPPDHHLLVQHGRLRLARGPRENGHRPAVDPMFRSAARAYGRRVVGVVLSGALDDGTAGLLAVRARGGVTVAQDPDEALHRGMPVSAVRVVRPDHVLRVADIAALLVRLAAQPPGPERSAAGPADMEVEVGMSELDPHVLHDDDRPGRPSGFSCPDCAGVLWELAEPELIRYRCRVGHAWSPDSLLERQTHDLEGALWAALRSLEEKSALSHRLARNAADRGHLLSARRFEEQAGEDERQATLIRDLLLSGDGQAVSEALGG